MIDARRDIAQSDGMQRAKPVWRAMAGLCLAMMAGQAATAATPLWELRAQKKQAEAQKKPTEGQKKPVRTTPLQAEPPRITNELERVMGKEARTLIQLFGPPAQDVREATARKLQFASKDCILDAYLYAPTDGKDPIVTYVAARVADGREAERNSCISALRVRR